MKITNAVWEKRNLRVDAVEITVEQGDTAEQLTKILNEQTAVYCTVKLPSFLPEMIPIIHKSGYQYIEDMIHFIHYLNEKQRSPLEQRMHNAVSTDKMNDNDFQLLFDKIREGMFNSDRIYLDPAFTHEAAQNRYINWISDERTRGTDFYKYIYKNSMIGFFALREGDNGHYTSFLGGIFPEYQRGGLGAVVKVPEVVKFLGGKSVSADVSTNNIKQVKSLVMNGYIPEAITHTFVKHNN